MSNTIESKTEIQVDIPLTDEAKLRYADEMLNSMRSITIAETGIKDFQTEKKEEMKSYMIVIAQARTKATEVKLSGTDKLVCALDIIGAMNSMAQIQDELNVYKTEKQYEIAKNEAIVNINRGKINRGKDFTWVEVRVIKDFDKKTKTFIDLKTGEVLRALPLTDDELQLELGE
jgi:hypothetical protein